MLLTFKLCNDENKIRELGATSQEKITGNPDSEVHIAYQNYIIKYLEIELAVLQVDKFSDQACTLHGWVLPEYRYPLITQIIMNEIYTLFKDFSKFKKLIFPCISGATHIFRFLKRFGFIEEARIKDSANYNKEVCDLVFMTLTL